MKVRKGRTRGEGEGGRGREGRATGLAGEGPWQRERGRVSV